MQITTAEEYYQAVTTHDERMLQAEIDRIPLNVNRAGKHYRKLVKQIYETHLLTCNPTLAYCVLRRAK